MSLDLNDLERLPVVKLSIESVIVSDSPRSSGEDYRHVRMLSQVQDRLPPIIVHSETLHLIDGLHRLRASQMRGEKDIEVRLFDGDAAASYVLAVKANTKHGLPLPLADRKAAALRIISLYPRWSDRMVAAAAGLSPKTVAQVRARSAHDHGRPAEDGLHLDAIVGRDGRSRPRDSGRRRELVGRLLRQNPKASLREIARKAGVSPETVRSVRAGLNETLHSRSLNSFKEDLDIPWLGAGSSPPSPPDRRIQPLVERRGKRSVLHSLRSDPAFRSSDTGRSLLRLLGAPEMLGRHSGEFIQRMPPHCLDWVAEASLECAKFWQDFANKIDQVKESPTGIS